MLRVLVVASGFLGIQQALLASAPSSVSLMPRSCVGSLVTGLLIAIIMPGSFSRSRGFLVSSTVASLMLKLLHEETIRPGMIGWTAEFTMSWAWPFDGLIVTIWT